MQDLFSLVKVKTSLIYKIKPSAKKSFSLSGTAKLRKFLKLSNKIPIVKIFPSNKPKRLSQHKRRLLF